MRPFTLVWLIALTLLVSPFMYTPVAAQQAADVEHPRLLFNADELETLRNNAATTHAEIWTAIQTFADSRLAEPPPALLPDDASEETIRSFGDQLIPMAFACAVTEQDSYCDWTRRAMLTYSQWPRWDVQNRLDLGHAHMVKGMAIAYDWIYGTLPSEDRETILAALESKVDALYRASAGPYDETLTNWWAGSYIQNHYSTNNAALGIAGLALAGDTTLDAGAWIARAAEQQRRIGFLLDQAGDGTWHEGIPYQSYFLTMMLPFLESFRTLEGEDLFPHEYLRQYPLWRIYNYLPGSTESLLSFADFEPWWGNTSDAQNILRFAAREYQDGHAEWMAQAVVETAGRGTGLASVPWQVFEFLYYDPTVAPQPPTDLPLHTVFPDIGAVVWRSSWDDDALLFGLKAGEYGGQFARRTFVHGLYPWTGDCESVGCTFNVGHDHADANTFYIHQGGQWLVPEWAGYGVNQTASHNTVTINGENQFLPSLSDFADPASFAATETFFTDMFTGETFSYLASDVTGRYPGVEGLREVSRHVVFVRPDYFLILDDLRASARHRYDSFIHFSGSVALDGNWARAASEGDRVMGVQIVAPEPHEAIVSEDALPYIRVSPAGDVTSTRLIQLLYPTDSAGWETRPQAQLIADSGKAALSRVSWPDGSADDIVVGYDRGDYQVGDYASDAGVLVVQRDSAGAITHVSMAGGTFLADVTAGQLLINNVTHDTVVELDFATGRIELEGELQTSATIYVPDVADVTVNGQAAIVVQTGEHILVTPVR